MTGNLFIDGLDKGDRDALAPLLTPMEIVTGAALIDQGAPVVTVHFPTTAYLTNITLTPAGRRLQTALIGAEGMSGLAPFMADVDCAWQVSSPSGGQVLAASADRLRALMDERPGFRRRLLALTHFYQAQANQLAVCNAFHRIEPRVARWILTTEDLTGHRIHDVTQDEIAGYLGVQRTSVVTAFSDLKSAGLIAHRRGWLEIRDRAGLEGRACSCYRQLRQLGVDIGVLPEIEVAPARRFRSHPG